MGHKATDVTNVTLLVVLVAIFLRWDYSVYEENTDSSNYKISLTSLTSRCFLNEKKESEHDQDISLEKRKQTNESRNKKTSFFMKKMKLIKQSALSSTQLLRGALGIHWKV